MSKIKKIVFHHKDKSIDIKWFKDVKGAKVLKYEDTMLSRRKGIEIQKIECTKILKYKILSIKVWKYRGIKL